MNDPRRLALDVLWDVERHGAFADASLGRALDRAALADEDRRLATQLVYGVLAWQLRLDHTIDAYARSPRIDERLRVALRLGLFQIAFLDRMPHYAAVNTTVEMVRAFAAHAAGFANALLRRAAREGLASPPANDPSRTAVLSSHPPWLVEMWRRELGPTDADALMLSNNQATPTVLRALRARDDAIAQLHARGAVAKAARHAPDAIECSSPLAIPGVALPQGEASQLVALLLGAAAGQRVLDACAAPGGKTAYLAALVGESGQVVAVDAAAHARRRIEATCSAAGVRNVAVVEAAVEDVEGLGEFDAALVDAPCSGLGTLREHPEIRWRRSPDDVRDLAARQASILRAAAAHVRPGGALVYATCTISRAENEDVVDAFLADEAAFREDATGAHPAVTALLDDHARLHTFPHRHDMSGFFAARLRRTS